VLKLFIEFIGGAIVKIFYYSEKVSSLEYTRRGVRDVGREVKLL
jgi:hypothetical protein